MLIDGSDSTLIPSTAEAEVALPRVEESDSCTTTAVVSAGTAMVAVMRTLAAVMAAGADEEWVKFTKKWRYGAEQRRAIKAELDALLEA